LVKSGFNGKIYSTHATADIAEFILKDSAAIQEQDAAHINKHLRPGEEPVVPHFTQADVDAAMAHFERTGYFRITEQWTDLGSGVRFKFYDAGHILGSAVTLIESAEDGTTKRIAYTGDLGQPKVPILHDPEFVEEHVDALISECTYGDRDHAPLEDAVSTLADVIKAAVAHGSKIITPAFSLGRTQEILYVMHKLRDDGKIPAIPVYLDSPLAEDLTTVFNQHPEDFGAAVAQDFTGKDAPLQFIDLHYVRSVDDSKKLQATPGAQMVLSASGMCEGGRVLHHLTTNIGDPSAYILITGYQAENTLGRKIQSGVTPVKILNETFDVRAKVVTLDEFSAHADRTGLRSYMEKIPGLAKVFLVHTELPAAEAFRAYMAEKSPAIEVTIPIQDQSFEV
jgi:metallo-beta-lactamase family protein